MRTRHLKERLASLSHHSPYYSRYDTILLVLQGSDEVPVWSILASLCIDLGLNSFPLLLHSTFQISLR